MSGIQIDTLVNKKPWTVNFMTQFVVYAKK